MTVLIVTYDLNKETKRPPLLADLKKLYQTWAKLSESSYAIETDDTPHTVYQGLQKHLDDDDSLLVFTLKRPYYGQSSKDVIDWLESRLT